MTPGRPARPSGPGDADSPFNPALLLGDPVRSAGLPARDDTSRFEKIFNSSSMLLAFTEREGGRILDVNSAWLRAAGISRDEALAKTGSQLGLWADPRDREAILGELAAAGRVENHGCRLRMGGRTFPARISVHPVAMEGAHLLWEIQDLTEQERLARLAAGREDNFQQVFLNAPCAISLTRVEDGRILQVNRAWSALLGWSKEEAAGRTLLELGAYRNPEDRNALRRDMEAAGRVENWSFLARRKDGVLLHMQVGVSLVQMADEPCYLSVLQDFSTLHEAEEAVRVSEARFRALLDASPIAMLLTRGADPLYANPRFLELFGLEGFESVLGHSILERIAPASRPEILERVRRRTEGLPVPDETDLTGLRADGTEFPIHVMAAPMAFADGPATVIFVTDLSERVRGEAQRAHFQAQFMQAQKMESLGVLAGGVAHDMNNVLGAILALASVHQMTQAPDSPLGSALGTIAQAAVRGGKMVRSLLNFARYTPAEQMELDLNALLREAAHLLERTTLARVRLNLELAGELGPVRGDASALTHAFMNLCVNSVDAMPEQGTLTLRTRNAPDGTVEVAVEDTGTGMPPEVLDRATEPFYTTKPTGKGTGLGLSMVYSTVKAHDGRMEILSEPGRGTCVRMFFPACRAEAPGPDRPQGAPGPGPRTPLTVLLVDDDDLVLTSVRLMIDALGHRTVTAGSGEEALAARA